MLTLLLGMILLPLTIAFKLFLIPWKILAGLFRSGAWLGFMVVAGLFGILGGIISVLAGLLKGLFPFVLIAAGIVLIVFANKKNPKPSEEAFESFYAERNQYSRR